jgi:hypothetical protein
VGIVFIPGLAQLQAFAEFGPAYLHLRMTVTSLGSLHTIAWMRK